MSAVATRAYSALHFPLSLSPPPVVRCCTFLLSPCSLSLPRQGQAGEKSDAACACVCKCPRVCLFSFRAHSWMRRPVRRPRLQAVLSGEETRSPVAPSIFTLSSLRTKKKSGQAFIYCFACFLIAVFTIAIQGRDAPVHSFYESLSPVFFLFFLRGKLFCCVKSWMVGLLS